MFAIGGALFIGAGGLFAGSVDAHHPRRIGIDDFMAGLACVESVGNYDAVNERSGARGKYQFMPRIWRAWSTMCRSPSMLVRAWSLPVNRAPASR